MSIHSSGGSVLADASFARSRSHFFLSCLSVVASFSDVPFLNATMGEDEIVLSVEETNALRAKLGLKPCALDLEGAAVAVAYLELAHRPGRRRPPPPQTKARARVVSRAPPPPPRNSACRWTIPTPFGPSWVWPATRIFVGRCERRTQAFRGRPCTGCQPW